MQLNLLNSWCVCMKCMCIGRGSVYMCKKCAAKGDGLDMGWTAIITWIHGRLIIIRWSSRKLDSQCVTPIHSCNLYSSLPWWLSMQGGCAADLTLPQLEVANEMLNKRIQRYIIMIDVQYMHVWTLPTCIAIKGQRLQLKWGDHVYTLVPSQPTVLCRSLVQWKR
jgi:hypothetical protein